MKRAHIVKSFSLPINTIQGHRGAEPIPGVFGWKAWLHAGQVTGTHTETNQAKTIHTHTHYTPRVNFKLVS